MKAAAFAYSRPASLDEAVLLAADDGARVIAGGPGLAFVRAEADAIVIGATTTQRAAEAHALVRQKLPLLARALPWVGHAATRARGTIGGSLANADPAAEIGLVAVTLDATLVWRDGAKDAQVQASEFFLGPMVTALPATGVLTAVRFPVWREHVGVGFQE